ncbi:MAG TPA: hypothetical protein ENN94_03460 [Geoalkalibacter subterraneus]|uniref:Uncharacterized protein n=1 Tax=Geoalkalibacter subterraneus TaxID=483547 RepID=A0A831LH68_9BACT|nr:hypothetical protein [Geoalkalibacter subterraneus]
MMRTFLFLLIFSLAATSAVAAIPTINCHCFQDRAFDPANPSAADQYYLATTQNRLLAAVFDQPRRNIVVAKQKGTEGDDLWVAYRASAETDLSPNDLLREKKEQGAWLPVLKAYNISLTQTDSALPNDSRELARLISTEILVGQGFADHETIESLYAAGAEQKEVICATLLASVSDRNAGEIRQSVTQGLYTWGQIFSDLGLASDLDASFQRMLAGITPVKTP